MGMCVDESRKDSLALGVDLFGCEADPFLDFVVWTDGGHAGAGNSNGLAVGWGRSTVQTWAWVGGSW
jgi:hypothetical protein